MHTKTEEFTKYDVKLTDSEACEAIRMFVAFQHSLTLEEVSMFAMSGVTLDSEVLASFAVVGSPPKSIVEMAAELAPALPDPTNTAVELSRKAARAVNGWVNEHFSSDRIRVSWQMELIDLVGAIVEESYRAGAATVRGVHAERQSPPTYESFVNVEAVLRELSIDQKIDAGVATNLTQRLASLVTTMVDVRTAPLAPQPPTQTQFDRQVNEAQLRRKVSEEFAYKWGGRLIDDGDTFTMRDELLKIISEFADRPRPYAPLHRDFHQAIMAWATMRGEVMSDTAVTQLVEHLARVQLVPAKSRADYAEVNHAQALIKVCQAVDDWSKRPGVYLSEAWVAVLKQELIKVVADLFSGSSK